MELIREEMRRVLRFLNWRIRWWHKHAEWSERADEAVSAGLGAYAVRQAAFYLRVLTSFKQTWDQPRVKAAREAAGVDSQLADTFMAH